MPRKKTGCPEVKGLRGKFIKRRAAFRGRYRIGANRYYSLLMMDLNFCRDQKYTVPNGQSSLIERQNEP